MVAEIAPFLNDGDRTEIRTEAAFWVTRLRPIFASRCAGTVPDNPAGHLPKYQPGTMADRHGATELRGSLLLHLINDTLVVALVVWLWMPIVTRLFAGWLKKN